MKSPAAFAMPASTRLGLQVAVAAQSPVRQADLAARVALAGHTLAAASEADVVLPPGLTPAQLDAGLRAVAAGLRVSLPEAVAPGFAEAPPPRPLLTPRELEILRALGEGMTNKAVARQLGISAHTVKFHLEACSPSSAWRAGPKRWQKGYAAAC